MVSQNNGKLILYSSEGKCGSVFVPFGSIDNEEQQTDCA